MKFTSEDLMKAMGLQVGDKVKIETGYIFEVVNNGGISLERLGEGYYTDLEFLVDTEFEILPRPKRVGDLKCSELDCLKCPLKFLCEWGFSVEPTITLLENLESIEDFEKDDQEIYDLLKSRLDKVVEE